jgi:hypothetical protein
VYHDGSRRESVEREIERVHVWSSRVGVNVLGNSPPFDCSCSVPVFVRWSTPEYPRAVIQKLFLAPGTLSLFHACSADGASSRSWTSHCTEFAREAMTSILNSSTFEGVKELFVSYFRYCCWCKDRSDATRMIRFRLMLERWWPCTDIEIFWIQETRYSVKSQIDRVILYLPNRLVWTRESAPIE